jgi:hypothetical protein
MVVFKIASITYILSQQGSPLRMGQFYHACCEHDMVLNYEYGPSMSNHLSLPTITIWKVYVFACIT